MLSFLLVAALSGVWDDETFLGKGPTVGAGAAVAIGRHLSAEGELGWNSHHRDSGYLLVDGDTVSTAGRLSFSFTDRDARVRPFVSAGISWSRSTDLFTQTEIVPGPNGQPVPGLARRSTYRTSARGWEFGAGVEVKASEHFAIRPEARWNMTASGPSFAPGSLEPPLMSIRGGVTLVWRPK